MPRARLRAAVTAGGPVYAYAPPGFGLGTLLREALGEHGLTPAVVAPPIIADDLIEQLDAAAGPAPSHVLVIDDPDDEVGPQEATRLSGELGHVPVVVLGRGSRPAWEVLRTVTVVRPTELLAVAAPGEPGPDLELTGGWPSLAAMHATSESSSGPIEITAHLRRLWWPQVPAHFTSTLVTLVAAVRLLPALERHALPGIEAPVLDELLDLAAVRVTGNGEALEVIPALAQVIDDSLPREVARVRDEVARVRERIGTDDCGLGAAAARHDWNACARIVDRWWPELVFGGYRSLVQRVTLDVPEAVLRQHSGLALRAEYLGRLPVGTVPWNQIRPRSPLAQLAADRAGIVALRRTITAMIGRRVHGRLAEARRVALAAERFADICRVADLGPTVAAVPLWYLHAGLSCHLAGDAAAASRMYRKGWQLRDRADLDFVPRDLAMKTAVLRAADGRTAEARWWLGRAQQESPVHGVVEAYVDVTEQAASLLLALDSAELDVFDEIWDDVGDSYVRDEMWPFMVSAVVGRRLAGGDVDGALRSLSEVRDIYPATSDAGGLHTTVMGLLTAEASLAAGRPVQARAEADALPSVPPVLAFRALVAAVSGDPEEALHLVSSVDGAAASQRDRLRLGLVTAVAHHRLGADDLAGQTLEETAQSASRAQFPMAMATVPRADLEALAHLAPTAAELLRTLDARGIGSLVPESVDLVQLSDREQAVLEALVRHGSNDEIARALFVSVNTVKTQLRAVYGKLGVNNRREAVVAAHALGLLGGRSAERPDR